MSLLGNYLIIINLFELQICVDSRPISLLTLKIEQIFEKNSLKIYRKLLLQNFTLGLGNHHRYRESSVSLVYSFPLIIRYYALYCCFEFVQFWSINNYILLHCVVWTSFFSFFYYVFSKFLRHKEVRILVCPKWEFFTKLLLISQISLL